MEKIRRKPKIFKYQVLWITILMLLSLVHLLLLSFENTFDFWLRSITLLAILVVANYYYFRLYKHYYKGATKEDDYPPEIGRFETIAMSIVFIAMSVFFRNINFNLHTIFDLIVIGVGLIAINIYYIVLHKNYYTE